MTQTDDFDTDLEQEVTDETFEAGDAEETEAPQKKKGSGALFKVIVLLVALGGGGFFLARSGLLPVTIPGVTPVKTQQAQQAQPLPVPAEAKIVETAPHAIPGEVSPAAVPPSGMELAGAEVSGGLPPAMDAGLPEMPPMPVSGADPFAESFPVQKTAEADVQQLPDMDPFAAVPATAVMASPDTVKEDVTRNAKIMAAEITPVTTAMPVPPQAALIESIPASAPVATAEITALQGRIDSLEKSLAEIETRVATKADVSALKASVDELQQSLKKSGGTIREESPSAASPVEKAVKKTAATKAPAAAKPVIKESPAPAATSWVLRSAKPGTAWISPEGTTEMKTVVVGDTLDGLGKITAIFKDSSGRWVVKGTKGSVNQ